MGRSQLSRKRGIGDLVLGGVSSRSYHISHGRSLLVARAVCVMGVSVGSIVHHAGGIGDISGSTGIALQFLHGSCGSIDICWLGFGLVLGSGLGLGFDYVWV